jgi:hypothetical protein
LHFFKWAAAPQCLPAAALRHSQAQFLPGGLGSAFFRRSLGRPLNSGKPDAGSKPNFALPAFAEQFLPAPKEPWTAAAFG